MRRKRFNEEVEANAPPMVLRKYYVSSPAHSIRGGKSLAAMGARHCPLSAGSPDSGKSTSVPFVEGSPSGIYQPVWGVTNSCRLDTPEACQDLYNMNLAWQVAMGSQLRLRFEQEARLLKKARAKIARRDQRIQVREEEMKKLDQEIQSLRVMESEVHGLRNRTQNLETLLEAEVDMKKAAEAKNAELTKELESLRVQFSDLQVNNDQLSQQVSHLQAQVTGEERIKAAFEEFKKYEDNKVEQRCAEMDARLDKLSVDIDEELYPHMLMAIAGRRWVIGHGLRLTVMKCAESSEIRQAFANVVSAVLPKVRAPEDPWAVKEEVPLEDAIAANISRAEKKKKCIAVCRTHGIGFAHHARSDGIHVSVPTVVPQPSMDFFSLIMANLVHNDRQDILVMLFTEVLDIHPRTPIDIEKKLGPEGSLVTNPTLYRSLAGSLQELVDVVKKTLEFGARGVE
ncbi:hypothetical protein Tco_0712194 [Tanacetum coccineum]